MILSCCEHIEDKSTSFVTIVSTAVIRSLTFSKQLFWNSLLLIGDCQTFHLLVTACTYVKRCQNESDQHIFLQDIAEYHATCTWVIGQWHFFGMQDCKLYQDKTGQNHFDVLFKLICRLPSCYLLLRRKYVFNVQWVGWALRSDKKSLPSYGCTIMGSWEEEFRENFIL